MYFEKSVCNQSVDKNAYAENIPNVIVFYHLNFVWLTFFSLLATE